MFPGVTPCCACSEYQCNIIHKDWHTNLDSIPHSNIDAWVWVQLNATHQTHHLCKFSPKQPGGLFTCSIYFDIWDLQTGSQMKSFVNHSLNVGNVVCFFCKASMKIGAPLCTRCYSWGHNTNHCNSSCMVCPICDGPHHEDNHPATSNRFPLFPLLPMENPVPTRHSVRIAANLMPLTLLAAVLATLF